MWFLVVACAFPNVHYESKCDREPGGVYLPLHEVKARKTQRFSLVGVSVRMVSLIFLSLLIGKARRTTPPNKDFKLSYRQCLHQGEWQNRLHSKCCLAQHNITQSLFWRDGYTRNVVGFFVGKGFIDLNVVQSCCCIGCLMLTEVAGQKNCQNCVATPFDVLGTVRSHDASWNIVHSDCFNQCIACDDKVLCFWSLGQLCCFSVVPVFVSGLWWGGGGLGAVESWITVTQRLGNAATKIGTTSKTGTFAPKNVH